MKISAEEIKAAYKRMSDDELLAMYRDELTDVARACYDKELERRGLEAAPASEETPAGGPDEEPWAAAASCDTADAAWTMQSALESADIPARIHNDEVRGVQTRGFQVQVPASLLEDAQRLLEARVPDAIIVAARYENGVFRPLDEIEIREGTVVEVHVPAEGFQP